MSLAVFLTFNGVAAAEIEIDSYLQVGDFWVSPARPVEGQLMRMYASGKSSSAQDGYGFITFYLDGVRVGSPQPISIVGGRSDEVFLDWIAPNGGYIDFKAYLEPVDFEDPNLANNAVLLPDFFVDYDTDGDDTGNIEDIDDDNDGLTDEQEKASGTTNPLDWDSDDDGIGDGKEEGEALNDKHEPENIVQGNARGAAAIAGVGENQAEASVIGAQPDEEQMSNGSGAGEVAEKVLETAKRSPVEGVDKVVDKALDENVSPVQTAHGKSRNQTYLLARDDDNNDLPDIFDEEFLASAAGLGATDGRKPYSIFDDLGQSVLGFQEINDFDGDGFVDTEDPFVNDAAPVLKLKIKHLGFRKVLFDASDSYDDDKIAKYTLVVGDTEKIEQDTPRIVYKFPNHGKYKIMFMIEDSRGHTVVHNLTVDVANFSIGLILRFLMVLLLAAVAILLRRRLKKYFRS